MAAVDAKGLTKRFGRTRAVEAVDVTLAAGEVRGLLGPNGAGKTTLLRMLLGLVRPDGGSVGLFGRDFGTEPPLLDGVAGFVEEPCFYPYLSARANLEVLAELDDGAAHERIGEALDRVELAARADDRVAGYSWGMRQRLGIASALMRAPRLLLLDEPTAGLDPGGVRFMVALVRELSRSGVGVLLSSHQIDELEDVCDSFSVMHRGHVVWAGTIAEMEAAAPESTYRLTTSDDTAAREVAAREAGVHAGTAPDGGLDVEASREAMDGLVLALGRAGVAVRHMDLSMSRLEAMFFSLTASADEQPALRAGTPA